MNPPDVFKGRTVVVSGSSGGVGTALVQYFAAREAVVIGIDRKPFDSITKTSVGHIFTLLADLSTEQGLESTKAFVQLHSSSVDILVNAAGTFKADSEGPDETAVMLSLWRDNVLTASVLTHELYPMLCRGAKPLVVNISSTDGIVASCGQTSEIGINHDIQYATTKGALITLTRCLAMKWARDRIRVNAICPIITRSPMTSDLLNQPGKEQELVRHIPLGRICEPADIAVAVDCLYRLEFTTAHVLPLDGGYLCL